MGHQDNQMHITSRNTLWATGWLRVALGGVSKKSNGIQTIPTTNIAAIHAATRLVVIGLAADTPEFDPVPPEFDPVLPEFDPVLPADDPPPLPPEEPLLPEEVPCPLDEPLEELPVEPPLPEEEPPDDPDERVFGKLDSVDGLCTNLPEEPEEPEEPDEPPEEPPEDPPDDPPDEPPDDPPEEPPDEPPPLLPGRATKSGKTMSERLETTLKAGMLRAEER
ncbi:MAG: hypothetical protein Q9220_002695 [cf. Caloplaca sp. 1 TL-2023]